MDFRAPDIMTPRWRLFWLPFQAFVAAVHMCCAFAGGLPYAPPWACGLMAAYFAFQALRHYAFLFFVLGAEPSQKTPPLSLHKEALEKIRDDNPEAVTFDGLDEAILGVAARANMNVLAYSRQKIVLIFMKQGMTYAQAQEYIDFNIAGAWFGDHTPVIVE